MSSLMPAFGAPPMTTPQGLPPGECRTRGYRLSGRAGRPSLRHRWKHRGTVRRACASPTSLPRRKGLPADGEAGARNGCEPQYAQRAKQRRQPSRRRQVPRVPHRPPGDRALLVREACPHCLGDDTVGWLIRDVAKLPEDVLVKRHYSSGPVKVTHDSLHASAAERSP